MTSTGPVIETPTLLVQHLEAGHRLLGIDLGTKTIGLAVSDPSFTVASSITTLKRTKLSTDVAAIAEIAEERNVAGLVVGLPINMDGSEGPRAQATRDWAKDLAGRLSLPVTFWDERMSTMAVERAMLEADLTRGKRAQRVDQAAAAYILQAALDSII